MNTTPPATSPITTDALIIGAGPIGLFQVFQLGLLGIHAHVLESLPYAGGQCTTLWADKFVYDIPAVVKTTGQGLINALLEQLKPFEPIFHFKRTATHLKPTKSGDWEVQTQTGQVFLAQVVIIAAGIGAFTPKLLKVSGSQSINSECLHYHAPSDVELVALANQSIVINGGTEDACQLMHRILQLRKKMNASHLGALTLVHRRDILKTDDVTKHELEVAFQVQEAHFIAGQITALDSSAASQKLHQVVVEDLNDRLQKIACAHLFYLQGTSPKLGTLPLWGLTIDHHQLVVSPATMKTSGLKGDGLYAVGDINTYPEKKKLIVCGFHEATQAAYLATEKIAGTKPLVKYTTTNSQLKQFFGT